MTTEDDFQAALDANPSDWQTRLVFADWLQDRGDMRAEGYRALGVRRLRPTVAREPVPELNAWWAYGPYAGTECCLPDDWWRLVTGSTRATASDGLLYYDTRRAAEDAAALAFAKLPPERRAELLALQPAGAA